MGITIFTQSAHTLLPFFYSNTLCILLNLTLNFLFRFLCNAKCFKKEILISSSRLEGLKWTTLTIMLLHWYLEKSYPLKTERLSHDLAFKRNISLLSWNDRFQWFLEFVPVKMPLVPWHRTVAAFPPNKEHTCKPHCAHSLVSLKCLPLWT